MESNAQEPAQVPTTSTTQVPTQEPTSVSEVPVITNQVKTKNAGRVAAGKRLAAISKAARERKKLATKSDDKHSRLSFLDNVFSYQNILALVGISIGAAALFYELYPRKAAKPETVELVTIKPKAKPLRLESLD